MKLLEKAISGFLKGLFLLNVNWYSKLAFRIFCFPFVAKPKENHMAYLQSGFWKHVAFRDGEVALYKWGSGSKSVLFIHGWDSHSFRWRAYIDYFIDRDYTVYSMDLPGHGLSKGTRINLPAVSDAIQSVLQAIGHPVEASICHSFGGYCMMYSAAHSNSINPRKIITMGSPGSVSDFVGVFMSRLDLGIQHYDKINDEVYKTFKMRLEDFDIQKYIAKVEQAHMIIHDREDEAVDASIAIKMKNARPESKLILTSGLGHKLKGAVIKELVFDFVDEANIQSQEAINYRLPELEAV